MSYDEIMQALNSGLSVCWIGWNENVYYQYR